jgi:GNAT superfamily N-acetyltransferase
MNMNILGDPAWRPKPMMTTSAGWQAQTRKLLGSELPEVGEHLLRLDRDSLLSRFNGIVSSEFLAAHAKGAAGPDTAIFGCRVDSILRGVAELRRCGPAKTSEAEAAFSVEKAYQDRGIGTALMGAVLAQAQLTGLSRIFIYCDICNWRMQSIVFKFDGSLDFIEGQCTGEIALQ